MPNHPSIFCRRQDGLGKGRGRWGSQCWLSPADTGRRAAGLEGAAGHACSGREGGVVACPRLIKVCLEHGDPSASCPGRALTTQGSRVPRARTSGPAWARPAPHALVPGGWWRDPQAGSLGPRGGRAADSKLICQGWVQAGIFSFCFILGKLGSLHVLCLRGFEEWCWAWASLKGSPGTGAPREGTLGPRESRRLPS